MPRATPVRLARSSTSTGLGRLRHPEWRGDVAPVGRARPGPGVVRRDRQGPTRAACTTVGGLDRLVGARGPLGRDSPGNTVVRVAGSGDFWWGEWKMTYPDGRVYECVDLIELREGMIWRETVYWAEPFDAPEWRRPFVERAGQPPA